MFESDIIQLYTDWEKTMNRRKKANQILKSRAKKANAKLNPNNKPKYISKADRETVTTEHSENNNVLSEDWFCASFILDSKWILMPYALCQSSIF